MLVISSADHLGPISQCSRSSQDRELIRTYGTIFSGRLSLPLLYSPQIIHIQYSLDHWHELILLVSQRNEVLDPYVVASSTMRNTSSNHMLTKREVSLIETGDCWSDPPNCLFGLLHMILSRSPVKRSMFQKLIRIGSTLPRKLMSQFPGILNLAQQNLEWH